ncbi:nitrogen regulatory protein P-II family [Rhodovulum steppense]|uniref:Nitrogen regulatory protein P-II n=1 Tax=Rhodovulum steppense TaxID=540251 RepID=A0A4R1YTH0_9RHOB|nr:nitrogen regulatory protein P-II family [Rhodovulum steppense]
MLTFSAFLPAQKKGASAFLCKKCAKITVWGVPGGCDSLSARRLRPLLAPLLPQGLLPNRKGHDVKLIIAAIKPFKLEEVREALTTIGVRGMMVTEIKGFGSQSGHTEIYRGAEYAVNFVPKVKLEIVVPSAMADQVVETIAKTAKTDKIGDGKIFVLDVNQAVRVRTGETNEDAI